MVGALATVPASARTVEDEQLWTSVIARTGIAPGLEGSLQIQNRMTNHIQNRSALLVRPVLTYALGGGWTAAASFAHIDMPLEPNARRGETQLYQQIGYAFGRVGGGALSTRMRLEQRWRDGREKTGWRLRGELRWLKPLARRPGAPSLLVWEEPLLELKRTDFGQTAGDVQARTFVGISVPLTARMRIEPGYLNVYGQRQNAANLFYHIGQVTLHVRL